jgi:hypothetical protein
VDDRELGVEAIEAATNRVLVADQNHTGPAPVGLDRAGDDLVGGMVAAHGIDGNGRSR